MNKPVPHDAFCKRFHLACNGNPEVPPPNYGRLGWLQKKLADRGTNVSIETVRKWFAGESRPRTQAMTHLAMVLGLDEAWLALGTPQGSAATPKPAGSAAVDAAVFLVAGLVQMCGGSVAFPHADDTVAAQQKVNLTATIKSVRYAFHVTLAEAKADGLHFSIPGEALENALVIGVVRTGALSVDLYEIEPALVEAGGTRRGTVWDFPATADWLAEDSHRIRDFSRRP